VSTDRCPPNANYKGHHPTEIFRITVKHSAASDKLALLNILLYLVIVINHEYKNKIQNRATTPGWATESLMTLPTVIR